MNRNTALIRTLGVWALWGLVQAPLALPVLAEDPGAHAHAQAGKPVYQCPMHPQIVREHPGTCPICYMELERVMADADTTAPAEAAKVSGKSAFSLSAERQQLIGLKVAKAEQRSLTRTLRLAGRAGGGQVVAQLQELDAGMVRDGQAAWVVGPEGSSVKARVVAVDNSLDALTRCYAVVLSLASRPAWLRGGIYVDVHVVVELGKGVAVPREAVFDTGERKVAFVRLGNRFEPRSVALGAVGDEAVFIKDGVKAGEEVVVGANFLIDSEARFRAVAEQYR